MKKPLIVNPNLNTNDIFKLPEIYDSITLSLLKIPVIKQGVIVYHIGLLYFRYQCERIGLFIERFINLNTFALILSFLCSRFHVSGYMIIACLLFIRIDFAVLAMCRFYKERPEIMYNNFPKINQIHRRDMWSKTTKIITEAATNPQVQAVGVAVTGALAWKALDIHDTYIQKEVAEADRVAAATLQEQALQAEKDRQDAALAAEKDRQDAALKAETVERDKDRVEENKRKAFEIMSSVEYSQLTEEQKERVVETLKTGNL